jgi:hypothetical protein
LSYFSIQWCLISLEEFTTLDKYIFGSNLTDLNELTDDDIKDGMGNDSDDAAMDLENGGVGDGARQYVHHSTFTGKC